METSHSPKQQRAIWLAIIVAALGYFVDIYDLILFGVVRVDSLQDLGITNNTDLREYGMFILDMQMAGMLLGGILWGVLGDKRGRLSVLFGSIILYSIANLANAFVQDVPSYAFLRFVAGVGLAGELGAGITLVSELMGRENRGYGTTIVATFGILGAVAASQVGGADWGLEFANWRVAYIVGGGMGLVLLLLRFGVFESSHFTRMKAAKVQRGNFFLLFQRWASLKKYLTTILIGVPIWYVVGILIIFSREISLDHGMNPAVDPGDAIMAAYIGLALGDLSSGLLSQLIRSRKKTVFIFLTCTALLTAHFLTLGQTFDSVSPRYFYLLCLALGFSTGYWAVFVTMASEQFGTNIRATATTTAPNFVRGSVPLLTLFWRSLEGVFPDQRLLNAGIVGGAVLLLAYGSLYLLDETYGKDLNYYEGADPH